MDKEDVKDLMKSLLYFGLIEESTQIHGLIE